MKLAVACDHRGYEAKRRLLPVLRAIAFPLVLTLVAIPLPAVLFNRIAFPLQLLASRTAETVMSAAGIPVLREGNVLELPSIQVLDRSASAPNTNCRTWML